MDLNNIVNDIDSKMEYFQEIGAPIIEFYSADLDSMMEKLKTLISSTSPENLNINELQYYFLQLTNILYFITSNVEKIGLLMDMANMSYKDAFNTSLLNNSSTDAKVTVAKLNALADKDTLSESVVNFIYSRTYKILKAKLDAANEMIKTLSKIISYRMQTQTTNEDRFDTNTKRLLMEG